MIEQDEKKIKDYMIKFYEELLKSAIIKEEYENAARYNQFIDNLKNSKNNEEKI